MVPGWSGWYPKIAAYVYGSSHGNNRPIGFDPSPYVYSRDIYVYIYIGILIIYIYMYL